ncbi:MAG: hypothetical protein K2P81_03205 [Bacteriovoracaceae bacterium]|nr:hypothetical protein [Bacteriovoracaceae bacterium]
MKLLIFSLIFIFSFSASAQFNAPLEYKSSWKSVTSLTSRASQHMLERSKVSYFGEMSGPSAKKWDDNQINPDGSKSRDPINMWHSFNMMYRMFNSTSLYMSPRFVTVFGDRNDLKETQDQHVVVMDDWQFGFSQNWVKTNEVSWDTRLSHRAPISTESKQSNIDSQIELLQVVTWKPLSQVFILSQSNIRYYKYEPQVDSERYRLNQMTAINWIFNDKWKAQVFNEFDVQHRNSKNGSDKKDWNYFKKDKDVIAFGMGYNPNPSLTIMPFIKALNDTDIRPETMQIGFWAFGKLI